MGETAAGEVRAGCIGVLRGEDCNRKTCQPYRSDEDEAEAPYRY